MSGFLGILGFECRFQGWYENGKTLALASLDRPYDLTAAYQPDYTPIIIEILLLALVVALTSLIAIFGVRDWRGRLGRSLVAASAAVINETQTRDNCSRDDNTVDHHFGFHFADLSCYDAHSWSQGTAPNHLA
jgi:hypothetical protein